MASSRALRDVTMATPTTTTAANLTAAQWRVGGSAKEVVQQARMCVRSAKQALWLTVQSTLRSVCLCVETVEESATSTETTETPTAEMGALSTASLWRLAGLAKEDLSTARTHAETDLLTTCPPKTRETASRERSQTRSGPSPTFT